MKLLLSITPKSGFSFLTFLPQWYGEKVLKHEELVLSFLHFNQFIGLLINKLQRAQLFEDWIVDGDLFLIFIPWIVPDPLLGPGTGRW